MKDARPAPKSRTSAPRPGATTVAQSATASSSASEPAALVTVEHGQPITTTEAVASAAGLQHKNVIALVREHLADFREFGPVAFETRRGAPLPQGGYGASTEYARLNEPQSALLFTFMRNTKTVRAVKVRLVREFFFVAAELRNIRAVDPAPAPLPMLPVTYSDALRALADSHDSRHSAELALLAAESRAAAQQPAVEAQARLAAAEGEMCIRDTANTLGWPERRLAAELAARGWIYRRDSRDGRAGPWRAMRAQIAAGRLVHRSFIYLGRDGSERMGDQVRVTPRGLAKLAELLAGVAP